MNILYITSLIAFVANILISLYVYLNNRRSVVNVVFALYALALAIWIFGDFFYFLPLVNIFAPLFWVRLAHLGAVFTPALFVHFIYAFTHYRYSKKILYALYGLCGGLGILNVFGIDFIREVSFDPALVQLNISSGWFYRLFLLTIVAFLPHCFYILINKFRASGGLLKEQIRYYFLATGTVVLAVVFYFPTMFGIEMPRIDNLFQVMYTSIIAYAIVKHHLMDIDVIIRKSIIYSALIFCVAAVYTGIVFSLQAVLQNIFPIPQWALILLGALTIAFGFRPLEDFITNATDKIFFKRKFDYQKALREISGAMVYLTTMDRLVDLITRVVVKTMRLEGGAALVLNDKSQRYVVVAALKNVAELKGVSVSNNYRFIEELQDSGDLLIKEDILARINTGGISDEEKKRLQMIKEEFEKFKAEVMVPTFSKGKRFGRKLIGILSLGEKKSQDVFSTEDLNLLRTLANQASVALENSIMYDEQVKSRDLLMKSEKMAALGTMAAGIVHELKNPLAFMQTVSQLMALKWDDKEFRETTTKLLPQEVLRMKEIVDGLLTYSKHHSLKLDPVDIREVINNVLTVESYEIRKNSIEVKKEFPSELPLVIGDKNSLMQIMMNLISNAIQAMRRGGTLTIKTENLGVRVAVKVIDSGIGIPHERIKEIFNPFYTTKDVGTGLGLSITQKLVEEHKGAIDVSSVVGEGTTFTVYLPVVGWGLTEEEKALDKV